MVKLDKNQTGLIVGIFLALIHLIWAILVWVMPTALQGFLNWIFELHALEPIWKLTTMTIMNAILLVIMTFVIGCITGWVFAWIWNMRAKK
jgi:hypothetical protein